MGGRGVDASTDVGGAAPQAPPFGPSGQADDGGTSADGSADIDTTAALGVARCGEAPFKLVRLGARDMTGATEAPHLAGVTVTLGHCPDRRFATGPDGGLMLMVSRDVNSWIRFESPGHVPWLVGELRFDDTLPPVVVTATMVPTKLAPAILPGIRPDGPLVYVEVQAGQASAPQACRTPEGVTLTVKDHPAASVLYRASGSTSIYGTAMTSEEGVALIAGLPPSGLVELVASKPGCVYRLAYGDVNSRQLVPIGRTPLLAGTITHQVFNPIR